MNKLHVLGALVGMALPGVAFAGGSTQAEILSPAFDCNTQSGDLTFNAKVKNTSSAQANFHPTLTVSVEGDCTKSHQSCTKDPNTKLDFCVSVCDAYGADKEFTHNLPQVSIAPNATAAVAFQIKSKNVKKSEFKVLEDGKSSAVEHNVAAKQCLQAIH